VKVYGLELLRGLAITLGHFISSYTVGFRRAFRSRRGPFVSWHPDERGIFTVQYPEERLAVPERFRVLPVLLFDGKESQKWAPETERCTACGICAKVCPPQCIWIVQAKSQEGKPIPKASEFYIDVDVCMNCGLCAEFCPFDAIKMDHDFEIASYDRTSAHIWNKAKLDKPVSYYASIRPTNYAREEAIRAEEAARKAAKKAAAEKK